MVCVAWATCITWLCHVACRTLVGFATLLGHYTEGSARAGPGQALGVEDMSDIKESVDDYLERNQEAFDEFATPDDVYYDLIEQLDSLEVRGTRSAGRLPASQPGDHPQALGVGWHQWLGLHGSAAPCVRRMLACRPACACMHAALWSEHTNLAVHALPG